MRCPVCQFNTYTELRPPINTQPVDSNDNPIFLWDRIWFSDSDDWDTVGYVVDILNETTVRVLFTVQSLEPFIEVWDLKASWLLVDGKTIYYHDLTEARNE